MVFNPNSYMVARSPGVSQKQNTTNFGKERIGIHKRGGKFLRLTDVLLLFVVIYAVCFYTHYNFRKMLNFRTNCML